MKSAEGLDRCQTFINCQLEPGKSGPSGRPRHIRPAVTISRQAGAGARVVAEKLAALLQLDVAEGDPPWTVFDRNLMEKILEDHNLPARLAKFLPEDRATELQDITDEIFGLRPASWTMIQQTSESILKLAELGHVILVGRGSTVITASLPHVVHARLVAPLEVRLQHCREYYQLTARAAREFCQREDQGRQRYLKKYFNADVNDAVLYDLVVNTGVVGFETAAELIAATLRAKMQVVGSRAPERTNRS